MICFTLISCGKNRIKLISENSNLILPKDFKILQNETQSTGISDFEINIMLQFDENNFQKIIHQVDSLILVDPNWKSSNNEYYYENSTNQSEPSNIKIYKHNKTLKFVFNHI